ncbi:hypothetical protein TNCV_466461, partial [Trichonephila clavipes]
SENIVPKQFKNINVLNQQEKIFMLVISSFNELVSQYSSLEESELERIRADFRETEKLMTKSQDSIAPEIKESSSRSEGATGAGKEKKMGSDFELCGMLLDLSWL